jgi:hypothetical protein
MGSRQVPGTRSLVLTAGTRGLGRRATALWRLNRKPVAFCKEEERPEEGARLMLLSVVDKNVTAAELGGWLEGGWRPGQARLMGGVVGGRPVVRPGMDGPSREGSRWLAKAGPGQGLMNGPIGDTFLDERTTSCEVSIQLGCRVLDGGLGS